LPGPACPEGPVPGRNCEKSAADKHNRQAHRIPFKNSYFRGLRMMLSRICHLTAAGVLLSLTAISGAESSQQTTPRGWWRNPAIVKDLGLTAEQSARLNAIFETTMPELRQDREELERLEAKLSRMIQDDRMDEPSLVRQIDRVETARANGNKTRSLMLMRMYRVLTREQRTRFDQLSKEWAASAGSRPPFPPPSPKPGASPQSKPAPSDSQRRPG
jgi:Spy/CpxP family protein refolding chaperone